MRDICSLILCDFKPIAEQTLERLLEMFDNSSVQNLTPELFPQLDGTIEEVPHFMSETPFHVSTNPNAGYFSDIPEIRVEALKLPAIAKPTANHMSPLNAVMPFAKILAPKPNLFHQLNNNGIPSSRPKHKGFELKDKIKQTIQSKEGKVLVLLRGLPGSGKTYLANELVRKSDGIILSTDDYFIRSGVYCFEATQLPTAHEWNQRRAKLFIEKGRTPVIIDNTNLEGWEMKPYVSFGYTNGYKIFFLEPDNAWSWKPKDLARYNVHGIKRENIERMLQRYQRVTVEDVIKSLPSNSQSIQKSNSVEKMDKNMISTNGLKKIVLRSSSSPSNAICSSISSSAVNIEYSESPQSSQTSVSAQIEDMTNYSQFESSSSPVSPDSTSPLPDTQIDIDLLLALNQRNADSEDCSSVNASDASSQVSQESGWERDDEFTYAHNTQQTVIESNDFPKPSGSGLNGMKSYIKSGIKSELKPQRDRKPRNELKVNKPIEEQNSNDVEFSEPWDELNEEPSNKGKTEQNITQDEQANSKLKKFSLVGVRKPNWEFPAFPIDQLNDSDSDEMKISISCYSRQTQTERKDWALLELRRGNKDSNEGLETDSSDGDEDAIRTEVDPNRNLLKVMLHKGTFTTDMPDDMTRDQKLSTLRQKFPKAEDKHLNEILDACIEDDKWAEKLLSELDDNHFDVGALEQFTASAEPSVSSPEIDSESISTEEEEPFEIISDPKNSEEPEFVITLDPLLAAQLQSHFGCLNDTLTPEDLTITLSHGVARLLHHNWKKSLNQKSLNQSSNTSKTQSISISHNFNNNNKNKKNISNEKTNKTLVLEQNTPKSELQEIMDLELAKALSRQEYDQSLAADALNGCPSKKRMAKDLLSTKLKRDQLYQRYPGVDQSFLDTIFESNK